MSDETFRLSCGHRSTDLLFGFCQQCAMRGGERRRRSDRALSGNVADEARRAVPTRVPITARGPWGFCGYPSQGRPDIVLNFHDLFGFTFYEVISKNSGKRLLYFVIAADGSRGDVPQTNAA